MWTWWLEFLPRREASDRWQKWCRPVQPSNLITNKSSSHFCLSFFFFSLSLSLSLSLPSSSSFAFRLRCWCDCKCSAPGTWKTWRLRSPRFPSSITNPTRTGEKLVQIRKLHPKRWYPPPLGSHVKCFPFSQISKKKHKTNKKNKKTNRKKWKKTKKFWKLNNNYKKIKQKIKQKRIAKKLLKTPRKKIQ